MSAMWLNYNGLSPGDLKKIIAPSLVLVGYRDEEFPPDVMVPLHRPLTHAELAVCPHTDHFAPLLPERAEVVFARVIPAILLATLNAAFQDGGLMAIPCACGVVRQLQHYSL